MLKAREVKAVGFIKLMRKLVVYADRSLHDLREERYEQQEFERVALGGSLFAVDVYDVAH